MTLLEDLKGELPAGAEVENVQLEGSKIVIFTKEPDYFRENPDLIKKLVGKYKKRIDVRAHSSLLMDREKAEKKINEIVPEEGEIANLIFLPDSSRVIIEARKPGLVIGKNGQTLREIKKAVGWAPHVERTPTIPSNIIKTVRHVIYTNADERSKFLQTVGRKVKPSRMVEGGEEEERWVRVSTLGGCREVGRSCFLVQTPDSRILLDCGVNVAVEGSNAYPYLNAPEFDVKELDAIIISHAHLDHSGFVPYLFKYGYDGPVYCTPPTRDLALLLQLDYIDIAQREGKKVPYTNKEVQEVIKHCITLDYEEVTDITPDTRLTLYNAGHILGSSQVHLHIGEGLHNIIYTGDMKYNPTNLFEPATSHFKRLETLIMESTYGGSEDIQPVERASEAELEKVIVDTMGRGGKVLIPVLAVGRAQELMIILEKISRERGIKFNVYLDGMIWDATAIHVAYPEYLSRNLRNRIFHKDQNPFLSEIFKRVGSQKEREALIESSEPAIILATSGMLCGGPSVEYFRRLADDAKNSMIFVSYQSEGTLGSRIQKGRGQVTLENSKGRKEAVNIKLSAHTITGFSGHSDRKALMRYVGRLNPKPHRVLIVHGDHIKCLDLASSLHKKYRLDTYAPKTLESIRLK